MHVPCSVPQAQHWVDNCPPGNFLSLMVYSSSSWYLLFLFLNYFSFVLQRYKSCWDFPYTLMRQQGSKTYLQRGWPSEYLVCHIAMILSIPGTTNPLRETRQGSEHSNEVSDYWQTKYCCFLTTLEYNLMPFSQWEFFLRIKKSHTLCWETKV